MNQEPTLYAAVLCLSRSDVKALRITDAYSLHRVVYDLFDDVRNQDQKKASQPSGILFADKGGDFHHRQILLLADRLPKLSPLHGTVEYKPIYPSFLQHQRYAFEVLVNPTRRDGQSGKLIALREREAVGDWFAERATGSWGFRVDRERLQVDRLTVQRFVRNGQAVTHGSASVKGLLNVLDQEQFQESFRRGIGRGRAFGFGLLQIVPL